MRPSCHMTEWTRENVRHALGLFRQGRNPAATVYDSIGSDFFLAVAPGWLNLGLWEGPGTEREAPLAVRRLVASLAEKLPPDGLILDVGNGLGVQDVVIAETARPRRLVAMNITESQLRAGREAMAEAGALPVLADAMRIPLRSGSVDGVISVEAAFHFRSRRRFFDEAFRVLRAGGVLSMSDVTVERWPRTLGDAAAGLMQLRIWGMRTRQLASAGRVAGLAEVAGFADVRVDLCAARTIDPALRLARSRLVSPRGVPRAHIWGAQTGVRQVERLRRGGFVQYALLRARAPTLDPSVR